MEILKGAMVITALALAAPVWAQGEQGYDRGRDAGRGYHHLTSRLCSRDQSGWFSSLELRATPEQKGERDV